jgi:hypothetical protein
MAALEVIALVEGTPQLRAPGSGDTYTMPRDTDHANTAVTGVKQLTVSGDPATYTAQPLSYILINANHTYDYNVSGFGALMSSAVEFSGTHTLEQSGYLLGMGFLFNNTAIFKNVSGEANAPNSFFTVNAAPTFRADGQTLTQPFQIDFVSNATFDRINSGALTATSYDGYLASGGVGAGCTITTRRGFTVNAPGGTGTLTGQAGFACSALTGATNNTHVLIGTTTVPSGNFAIHQANAVQNLWNGGQRWKQTVVSTSSATLTAAANHVVLVSYTAGVCTITLPNATTCAGVEFEFKKTGSGGSVSVVSVSSQTFDGAASPLASIATQYHTARIMSDGANWIILKSSGAP